MGKLTSLNGKVTGKIGAIVYSTSGGVTIAREYNPNVSNPNTVSQMNQRARLKLASQLAAALAPVIAIPKNGLVSSRNLFIQKNMEEIIANNGTAQIIYENIQLTNGNAGLPTIVAARDAANKLTITLQESADAAVSRVVYIVYKKSSENTLQYCASAIISEAGDNGLFPCEMSNMAGELVIWAYGMKDMSASATVRYGSYSVTNGEDLAKLLMSRTLSSSDFQFTRTRGTTLFSGEDENVVPEDNQFMVYYNVSGPGTVTAPGFTGNRKAVTAGESITLTAVPNEGCEFVGWRYAGETQNFQTAAELTLVVNNALDLIAVFNNPNSGSGSTGEGDDQ